MKRRSIALLLAAEVAAMSLWFVSAAILPDMLADVTLSPFRQAALSSGVQAGFVIGALASAVFGLADRYDPRRVFAFSAVAAGLVNTILLVAVPGSALAIAARVLTGALLAGVYPVGMKIAVGWGKKDRGLLVGALVGALTLGSALPHLLSLAGGTNWQMTILIASMASVGAGILCLFTGLGPHHARAAKFSPAMLACIWTNKHVRLAFAGYLGHMWELYAMWAWIGVAAAASYGVSMAADEAAQFAKLTAFLAIGAGGIACVLAGYCADRVGKANITIIAMALSGTCALATALTFGGPVWLTFTLILVWGITIIPDSAQFSAIVADVTPPEQAGSLMTLQTALGFSLTFVTVQAVPWLVGMWGWPTILAGLALGPAFGILAMVRLKTL